MNETIATNTDTTTKNELPPFGGLHLSDEELARMRHEMEAIAMAEGAEAGAAEAATEAMTAEVGMPASIPAPAPAPAPAKWEPKPDPHATPEFMAAMRPLFYLWTRPAIEKGAYLYEVSEGAFEKRYRALDGLAIGRVGKPGDGAPPCVAFWLYEPTLASDRSGRILTVGKGRRVHVACNEHMREILPMLNEEGAPHLRIRPLGFETLSDGTEEMTVEITVEPDPANPNKPHLVSLATVLGQGG